MNPGDGGYAPKGFTMATPVRPGRRFRINLIFLLGKIALKVAKYAPLEKVATIHFASFVYVDDLPGQSREQLLFASVFDGTPGEYLSDFGTLVPREIDQIWSSCVDYPGARSGGPFIKWLGDHQIENGYFYSAYEGETVPDVQHATELRDRVRTFVRKPRDASLRERFLRFLRDAQDLLG